MQPVTGDELKEYAGRTLLPSEWMTITQERIDQFADVTDDHQFIHVDEGAARATPLGSTIAHGFLTLSLLSPLRPPDWPVLENSEMVFNYGLDKLRFVAPVKTGSRVRVHTKILAVREKSPGQYLIKSEKTMEIEGEEKPAFVAQTLVLVVGKTPAEG
jgi:acyl dehydratase